MPGKTSPQTRPGDRSDYMALHPLKIISRVHVQGRARMFDTFMRVMQPDESLSILDLGVTQDDTTPGANFFEVFYPHKHRITCAGVEDASHLEVKFPGVRFTQIKPNDRLPFPDKAFDIVFSAAVLEHVGSRENQSFFISEALRVSRRFFLTTPNRWFPLEVHTSTPFLHYLPPQIYRRIYRWLGFTFYAREETLNILDAGTVRSLFPPGVEVHIAAYRILGLPSNLLIYGKSPAGQGAQPVRQSGDDRR